jgi:hypothetical protein
MFEDREIEISRKTLSRWESFNRRAAGANSGRNFGIVACRAVL